MSFTPGALSNRELRSIPTKRGWEKDSTLSASSGPMQPTLSREVDTSMWCQHSRAVRRNSHSSCLTHCLDSMTSMSSSFHIKSMHRKTQDTPICQSDSGAASMSAMPPTVHSRLTTVLRLTSTATRRRRIVTSRPIQTASIRSTSAHTSSTTATSTPLLVCSSKFRAT